MPLGAGAAARVHLGDLLEQLRQERLRRGELTQDRLAKRLGLSTGSVAGWETDDDVPTLPHLIHWAHELGFRLFVRDADERVSPSLAPSPSGPLERRELERLASVLRARRVGSGISQATLADRLGVSAWTLSRWEGAHFHPRSAALVAWAEELGCSLALTGTQS